MSSSKPEWFNIVRGARHKKQHFSERKPARDSPPFMMNMSKKRAALALTSQGVAVDRRRRRQCTLNVKQRDGHELANSLCAIKVIRVHVPESGPE
jgi:hypothetical protein